MKVSHLDPQEQFEKLHEFIVIDVRRNEEFNNELGHIAGAELIPIDDVFPEKLDRYDKSKKSYLFVKAETVLPALQNLPWVWGFKDVHNMDGGMLRWNELKLPVEKK